MTASVCPQKAVAPSSHCWYAVYTRIRFENAVHSYLVRQGICSYLPLWRQRRHWGNRTVELQMPLFPGYLFAHVDPRSHSYFQVLDARGVINIMGGGSQPVPVDQLQTIQAAVNSRLITGTIPWIQKGKQVRVVAGPLRGTQGVLGSIGHKDRLAIGVPSLGQSILTDADLVDVEACE